MTRNGRRVRSRRPPPPMGPAVPEQLGRFVRSEWPGPSADDALAAWYRARLDWHDEHRYPPPREHFSPLGTRLDILRGRYETRRALVAADAG